MKLIIMMRWCLISPFNVFPLLADTHSLLIKHLSRINVRPDAERALDNLNTGFSNFTPNIFIYTRMERRLYIQRSKERRTFISYLQKLVTISYFLYLNGFSVQIQSTKNKTNYNQFFNKVNVGQPALAGNKYLS